MNTFETSSKVILNQNTQSKLVGNTNIHSTKSSKAGRKAS